MKNAFLFLFILLNTTLFGQTQEERYAVLVKKADNLYRVKNYEVSGLTYSKIFKLYSKQVTINDRFNAACSWALAGKPDSAFSQLQLISSKNNYSNIEQITAEHDLSSLHKDKRWKPLIELIKQNKATIEARLNIPIKLKLDSIMYLDQTYRNNLEEVEHKYGNPSKELEALWRKIELIDSINLVQIEMILNKYGWLGPDVVGVEGNSTLFLVIQHSNKKTMEKYLPMMRDAVKKGNASAADLALLEDRLALLQGKKQIYGSQIIQDATTGKNIFAPIEDSVNVNKRRSAIGLIPIEEYAKHFGIEVKSKPITNAKVPVCLHMDFELAMEIQDTIVEVVDICMGFGKRKEFYLNNTIQERNSTWFKLSIYHDTLLTFDIVPGYFKEDYDFILYKCNDTNCLADLIENRIKAERICFSNNEEKYGATGLSEFANQKMVGAGRGDGYVSALPVKKGEVYYLMVNYAETFGMVGKLPSGFTIYFYNYWPGKPDYLKSKDPLKVYLVIDNILFESNKSILSNKYKRELDKVAKQLLENKNIWLLIKGYTDDAGSELLNQELSEKRARIVAEYLMSKGVDEKRLYCKGMGSKEAIAPNRTEKGRVKNRRVELRVLKYPL